MEKSLSLYVSLEGVQFVFHQSSIHLVDANYSFSPYFQHRHVAYELHYVKTATCKLFCQDQKYILKPHQMVLIPPNMHHRVYDYQKSEGKFALSFQILQPDISAKHTRTAQFYEVFQRNEPVILDFQHNQNAPLCRCADQLAELIFQETSNPFTHLSKIRTLCSLFVLDLFDVLSAQMVLPLSPEKQSLPPELIIDTFFGQNFDGRQNRTDLANLLNVCPRHLDRILHKRYGMSYREKLKITRLNTALDLLQTSEKSITEISDLLGYESLSSFTNFMKKETGKTPSELRSGRQHQE